MASFNRVTLMGNLTRDPLVKQLPNTTVAEFGLAMSRKFRTKGGEDREEVCFVDCTAFDRQAEVIGQYLQKGRPLLVEGRLKFDTWDDKNGGKRSKLSVVVENFQMLGKRDDGEGGGPPGDDTPGAADGPPRRQMFDRPRPTGAGASQRPAAGGRNLPAGQPEAEHAEPPFGQGQQFQEADIPF